LLRSARILQIDDTDRSILSLLVEDARRTYDDIGGHVSLSAPAVKRRIDRLRAGGVLVGFTTVVDYEALGWNTEALVELFWASGTGAVREQFIESLKRQPGVVDAWVVTGEADAIAHVRTADRHGLEQLLLDLQRDGFVQRTRSSIVLRQLVSRVGPRVGTGETAPAVES